MSAQLSTPVQAEPLRIPFAPSTRRRRPRSPLRTASSMILVGVVLSVVLVTGGMALGFERFAVVDSGSMRPTLNPGDVAILTSERPTALVAGQIVAFHPPGEPRVTVIHRVRAVEHTDGELVIQTKGDANNAGDPWHAKIAGTTVWRETARLPWVGYLVAWGQGPYIRMGVLALMLLLMVSIVMRWIWRPAPR